MSWKFNVCWIFLWITTAADVSAYYAVSRENITWQNATKRANFATPDIKVNNSTLIVNLISDLKEYEQVWVGYYQKETAFAYIGCDRLNNVNNIVKFEESSYSPGLCYSLCNKSNYIGLSKDKCICINQKRSGNMSSQECRIDRHIDRYWVVGKENDYFAMYERVRTDIDVSNIIAQQHGHCLAFETNHVLLWYNCSSRYLLICKNVNGDNVFIPNPSLQHYFKWWDYIHKCFENKSLPITYMDAITMNITIASGQSWTNVIRSDVIYGYTENSNKISLENVVKYGYITKHGNITVLSFTSITSSKRFLLRTIPVPETKPTSEQTRTSRSSQKITTISTKITSISKTGNIPNTTTSSSTSKSISTSTSSVTNGLLNSSETLQSNPQESTSKSSDVSVPVSISVVAVIIVAVIITIITLKRRGKFQGICTRSSAFDNLSKRTSHMIPADNKMKYDESAVDDYEQISELKGNNNVDVKPDLDIENGNYGHTYFILEPGSRESHTDGDMSDSKKDETEINDDYNTLHLNKTFGSKADDTYDTTEKAAIKLKALRNTGCEKESSEKLNGNEEDTYNHINRNLSKNNKTDNIYGVTDNHENEYGDVNNGCEKNRHNGDDTYSHLNTTH